MTSEESILFLGKTAQKLDQLASAFLEVKLRQEEASEKDRKAKEKKPSGKDGKEIARDEKGRFQRKEIKISEPSQNLKMLAEIEKEAKKQNKLNLQQKAPKVAENLTSTERKRWENIGTILGTAFKKIFEGREKVKREKGTGKDIQDLEFIENEKLENKKTSFFKKLLAALAFLSATVLGFISEIIAKAKQIYMLIKEFMVVFEGKLLELLETIKNSKFMEFVKGVYQSLKEKFFSLIEEIKNSKFVEFVKGVYQSLKEKFFGLIEEIKNSKFGRFVIELYESIKSKFFSLIQEINNSKLGKFVSETFEALKNKFFGIMQEIKNSKLGNIVAEIFQAVKSKFTSIASSVKDVKIGEIVGSIFSGISTKILQIFETIGGYFSRIVRILDVFAAGKGPLLFLEKMLAPFPEFLQFIIRGPLKMLLQVFGKGAAFGKFLLEKFPIIYLVIETITGLFDAFTDKLMEGKSFIQKLLTGIIYGITSFVNFFEFIGLKLVDFEEVRDRVDKVFSSFKDGFFKGILEIINQVGTFILGMGPKVGAWIVGWFDKQWSEALYNIAKTAKNPLDMFVKWWDLTKTKVVEYITEPFKKMIDYIKGLFTQPFEVVKNFFSGAIEGVTSIFEPVTNFIKNAYESIKAFFSNIDIESIISGIKEFLKYTPIGMILDGIDYIKGFFSNFNIDSIVNGIKTFFKYTPIGMILNGIDYIKSFFSNFNIDSIIKGIKQFFDYTPIGMLINNFETIKNFFGDTFGKIKNFFTFVQKKFDSIFGFIGDLLSKIFNFIRDKAKKIPLIGKLFEGEDTEAKQETYVENKNEKIPFVQNPFEASQEQPNQFMQSFQSPENQDFQSQSMFQVPEMAQPNEANNLFSMEKESSSPEGFGDVKTGIEDLNKNSSVNSKIAVDQLREIKELNKKMEQLVAQLASSRAMVVNNVRNSSVNSFLQPSTINSFRSSFRE